jgi:hypothetical protein
MLPLLMLLLAVATVSDLMGAGVSAAPMMGGGGDDADDAAAAFNEGAGEPWKKHRRRLTRRRRRRRRCWGSTSSQTAPAQAVARRTRVEAGHSRTGRGRSKGHQTERERGASSQRRQPG